MEIKVNRRLEKDKLVFEIEVTNPHVAPFSEEDEAIMNVLEDARNKFVSTADENNKSRITAEEYILHAKNKVFERVLESLRFSISNQLESKFNPMCQEIYNWIHDNQDKRISRWMSSCNPVRTKYYFDNDLNIEKSYDDED